MLDIDLVTARAIVLTLMLIGAGIPAYLRIAGRSHADVPLRTGLALISLGTALASLWWLAASVAAMAAIPLSQLDRDTLMAVATATPLGPVVAFRLVACAIVIGTTCVSRGLTIPALAGMACLCSDAWTGHAGAGEGTAGFWLLAADCIHLVGAAIWAGALCHFAKGLLRDSGRANILYDLAAFAPVGTAVVLILAITGSANAWLIAGTTWSWSAPWTWLLGAKILLFMAMLALAAMNRWRLVPALAAKRNGARGRLARSVALESACALAVVIIAAVLGLLAPAG